MGAYVHPLLKSLCSGSEWTYAVFWKLKHRARMVLTWEDAYYNSHGQTGLSKFKCSEETVDHSNSLGYSCDPLELALAKMSYYVYSLGEGIVGQVAASGKHQWLCPSLYLANNCLSSEDCDIWQTQFSAGIAAVLVIAVLPHGVLQLGSLNKVNEDVKLVTNIQDAFLSFQDSLLRRKSVPLPCSDNLLQQASSFMDGLVSEATSDCSGNLNESKEETNICSPSPYIGKYIERSGVLPLSGSHRGTEVKVLHNHEQSPSTLENHIQENICNKKPFKEEPNLDGLNAILAPTISPFTENISSDCYLFENAFPTEEMGLDCTYLPLDQLGSSSGHDRVRARNSDDVSNELLQLPEMAQKDLGKCLEIDDNLEKSRGSFGFPSISELHEALGPAFSRMSAPSVWEEDKTEAERAVQILEGISSSRSTNESDSEHLLEAVVAKVCQSGHDNKNEGSFSSSIRSPMVSGRVPEASSSNLSKFTARSVGYSIDQPYHMEGHGLHSSDRSLAMSSASISSSCQTSHSDLLERSSELAKNSKKRARPGENRRPRPRDRQLIQDRLKELRELVPSGSKCSIDALLERTIKHMLFLQSITKHADKLNKCAESKLHHNEPDVLGSSSNEQGSSWAVEVGSHLKVYSIMVENLSKKGQLLVEMMCEDCSHFLEIAEAIRSLGLTILKGVTEAHGEKIWICFVVEGQNNNSIHRMDVLWSLVQILQPKTST
ncbi:transcription factor EMB1444-like [Syzygium oleosum]|uniref:transcription factor EMB1444-like n=1 Tax=Syzygium oleosum TaxID=219896 RepID=UPI0024BB10BC|nr:transcription factor EMB1444-like [Syzygium oleosum]